VAKSTARLSGVPGELRDAADALRAEVEAASLTLTFRGLPYADYNRLILAHPPRVGNKSDEVWAFSTLTFFPALLQACLVDPVMSAAQWDRLLSVVTDLQFDELAGLAHKLNRRESTAVPFSSPASEPTGD
jgi:hypothetical protein